MPQIGLAEIVFLLGILALIFGAKRIPQIARGLGSGIRNFKGALQAGKKADSQDIDDRDA
ncbi:MAG: twin-arginine translocase TatA/TatE family subunit [Gemmatimonadota bacterium]|nr:twin-arginine translocase TatA/TatE family subunit [Gemmatimonadota bacterium]